MRTGTSMLVAIILGAVALALPLSAQAQGRAPKMTVEGLAETTAAHPGKLLRLAFKAKLDPGFHANSNKPLEDFLIPTVLTIEDTPGVTVSKVVYPEAETIKVAGSDTAVYEEEFFVGVEIALADSVPTGPLVIKGQIRYQACNDTQCFAPSKAPFELSVDIVDPATPLTPQHQDIFQSIAFGESTTPDAAAPAVEPVATPTSIASPDELPKLLAGFDVAATGAYMTADEFLAFLDGAETGKAAPASSRFEGMATWLIALTTLLGGLALNLTPCVLPLIPINLMIIGAGAKASSKSRGFALGGVYGLGMAIAYGALGLVVVLTTASFGGINASPWFNFAIALLFVILALAMFDKIQIDFTKFQSKIGIKRKEGGSYLIAFAMGVISALLAGACVAPVVIAVVLYSRDIYAAGNVAGILLPFLLGIGMALPWPIAGAGLSFLPKPGKWMDRVKYAFGAGILVLAGYYGWLGYGLFSERYLVDRQAVMASVEELNEGGWSASLNEGLAKAKAENKPVVIDFWATWCKNCLVMNKTTLKDSRVIGRLEDYVKIKYQAESPDESPHKEVLANFPDFVGLPYFVVLKPRIDP